MAPAPTLQELIETIRRDAASEDLLDQLAAARATVAEINDVADAALGVYVDRARRDGHSWTEISNVLGVTKQAVHKRFSLTVGNNRPWFNRYTDRARRAVEAAPPAAVELGHNYVGTEHLLLGLYAEPESIATKILAAHGIGRADVESAVAAKSGGSGSAGSGPGETESGGSEPPLTPWAAGILQGALAEALKLGHNYVGTEHVLLSMYRDPDGLASQILLEGGLDADTARVDVVEALSGYRARS